MTKKQNNSDDILHKTPEELSAEYFKELELTISEGSRVILECLDAHRISIGEKRMNPYALTILRRGLHSLGAERWKMVMEKKV